MEECFLNKKMRPVGTLPFEVFLSRFSRKTKDAFPLLKVSDYKIIQMLTAKLSRVSLQRYPDTDYTICLKTTDDKQPSCSSSLFIFWRDDKLPGHCHLVSNFSTSLALYQGDKRPGSLLSEQRAGHLWLTLGANRTKRCRTTG